jgi:short-subunit dehydrogenase
MPADLAAEADLDRVANAVAAAPPDLLVNNAGLGSVGRFAELDAGAEDRQIRVNVLALARLTRAALPGMIRRGRGQIVNVSSLAGLAPGPYTATYAATKAFVNTFTESLYEELRGTGVQVQALLPGFTRTEFQDRAGIDASQLPGFAWMTPEAVVEASLASLRRGELICVPGFGNRVLGVLQRAAPRALTRSVLARVVQRTLE